MFMNLNLLLTSFSLMLSFPVLAQLNMSSASFQLSMFDETTEIWGVLSEEVEELNHFEFNQNYTLLNQTTSTTTFNYLIHSYQVKESKGWVEYNAVSRTGKHYLIILDDKDENIRFITEREGKIYMFKYSIKDSWIDGE